MSTKWQKISIKVPASFKPDERVEVADLVIEHIFQRTTEENVDKKGRPFPKYSSAYKGSLDFKNAGKSGGNIDLQLSGDMLAAMKLLSHKKGEIVIGFEKGTEENAKADGNIRGTYGNEAPLPGKKRDFLGIEAGKLRELIDYVKSDEAT